MTSQIIQPVPENKLRVDVNTYGRIIPFWNPEHNEVFKSRKIKLFYWDFVRYVIVGKLVIFVIFILKIILFLTNIWCSSMIVSI